MTIARHANRRLRRAWVAVLSGLLLPWLALGGSIVWHGDRSRMDARMEGEPLRQVLETLAESTGWRIFVEPDATRTVKAQFTDLTAPAALRHLLGDLNYALVPDPDSSARLYVFQTSAASATQRIRPPEKPRSSSRIGNELIVTLDADARESIDELAARLGAKVIGRADDLRTYRLEFEDAAAADRARALLDGDEGVRSIDSNHRVQPPPDLDPLPFSQLPPIGLTPRIVADGDQIVVALLDTPIAADHPTLKDFLLPTLSLTGQSEVDSGQLTHATAMAETMLRALASLPQDESGTPVRILPIDIYGPGGTTTTFDVARGLLAAAGAGPAFINLSLGTDTDTPFLRRVIQDIAGQGTIIIAAAGNEPVATPVFPAAYPEVLAVTAADRRGQLAPYANFGEFVDVMGPGTALIEFENRPYFGTGTSYATAYITGVAAGLTATPHATPHDALLFIREHFPLPPISSAP